MELAKYRYKIEVYDDSAEPENYVIEANHIKDVINLISEDYEIWKIEKEGYSAFGQKYFNSLEPIDEDKNET